MTEDVFNAVYRIGGRPYKLVKDYSRRYGCTKCAFNKATSCNWLKSNNVDCYINRFYFVEVVEEVKKYIRRIRL